MRRGALATVYLLFRFRFIFLNRNDPRPNTTLRHRALCGTSCFHFGKTFSTCHSFKVPAATALLRPMLQRIPTLIRSRFTARTALASTFHFAASVSVLRSKDRYTLHSRPAPCSVPSSFRTPDNHSFVSAESYRSERLLGELTFRTHLYMLKASVRFVRHWLSPESGFHPRKREKSNHSNHPDNRNRFRQARQAIQNSGELIHQAARGIGVSGVRVEGQTQRV